MTFNIRHALDMNRELNLRAIADEIEKSGADVIGLQEVDRYFGRSGNVHQTAQLAEWLGMEWCYSASEDAQNTTRLAELLRESDAATGQQGGYGNALLSRFPLAGVQTHYLASDRERRSLLRAQLDVNGQIVTVFVTHLGLDRPEQAEQVETITQTLQDVSGHVVLMGDFNLKAGDPLLEQLPAHLTKVPLREKVTTFAASDRIMEIDHIFTNLPAQQGAWTQPTTASDHHPVLARLLI